MIWSVLAIAALVALCSFAWAQALDAEQARRTKRAGVIPVCRELPRAVAIPTAWRKR
jgi:hypothetical protein